MKIRVGCFDLDRTLTVGISGEEHLARALGFEEKVQELERRYATGEINNREVAERNAEHYRGRKRADLDTIIKTTPVIKGIRETVDKLHAEGISVIIGTIDWSFIAECFQQEYGFDASSGVVMGEDPPGTLSGKVARHFEEQDKVSFVEEFCRPRGITLEEVAAVGDSRSDIPLFEKVGLAIALNATPQAREAADLSIESDDLTVALKPILAGR